MATLDKVIEMQNQGKTDNEIMAQLQNEGIAPSEINQSLQQAKIKNAISSSEKNPPTSQEMQQSITKQIPTQEQKTETEPINQLPNPQTSSLPQYPEQYQNPSSQTPTQQPQPQYTEQPQQQYPEYDPNQQYYSQTPQTYQQDQGGYYPQESYSTETISEIATQTATEILEDYKRKVGDVASFKNQIQNKVEDLDDRLKKIENSIDKLQQAVLGKIGEFGDTTAMIHHDLDNLHGTVAKLMNPLIDNIDALEKHKKRKSSKK
jgi:hypothetical protein